MAVEQATAIDVMSDKPTYCPNCLTSGYADGKWRPGVGVWLETHET